MVRIRMSDLDETVKAFLARAQQGESIVIEDDNGRVQFGVTPYIQASEAERQDALAALSRLQQKSAQAMTQQDKTESDLDRELQN